MRPTATKFLRLKDCREPQAPENLLTLNSLRIPFGLICSAFILAATIHLHLTKTATPLVREVLTSCYVDNIFLPAETKKQAEEKYSQTKKGNGTALKIKVEVRMTNEEKGQEAL
ncbi:hypothetical protein TELCIR_01915 [Teladorsagia circumcincta]|uniref:Reverse transcriptase domain-containing protein n=1 Tax=Teladorsagia circumcincta TaxID=45464 RepID=A0A2G9V0J9_TELCI|nr:hypothetical protein TELCIR_01915 [Teladorsagia circumcincta]